MSTGSSLPLAGTQHGSMFSDRDDEGLTWYLPAFAPCDPTDAFSFAASEGTSVDSSGNPLDSAVVVMPVQSVDPPDVVAARQANPAARLQPIPPIAYTASLSLPYKDDQGHDQEATAPGQAAVQTDGTVLLTFSGLLGPTVIQAYEELGNIGGAAIALSFSYHVWQRFFIPHRPPVPPFIPLHPVRPVFTALTDSDLQYRPINPIFPPGPIHILRPFPIPPQGIWIVATSVASAAISLGTTYATTRYRPKYTITTHDGTTRPIIDASDLKSFTTPRSEFRELTSLGDVRTRYPSLDRLYLGQVSGTVVAIPAAYGIVRGSGGCAARLDAVVDTSPTAFSGCRFQFTLEIAPVVDPTDLAQLADDLKTIPEAAQGPLTLMLPSAIDPRVGVSFSSQVSNLVFADAPDGKGLLMSFEVTDTGSTPALVNVNLLLAQFTSASSTPLFGTFGVRLDDVYTPPVQGTVVVGLAVTCATDDLAVTIDGTPPAIIAINQSPNDLRLIRMRTVSPGGASVQALGDLLPAGQQTPLPLADASTSSVVVQRTLAVPDPFPRSALTQYLDIHAETVQQATHGLTVNATSIDFAAEGIAELDIQITLDNLPTVAVPALILRPDHRIDSTNVVVPIDAALSGLAATLTIAVQLASNPTPQQVQLTNDFAANPIFVLTGAALGLTLAQPATIAT